MPPSPPVTDHRYQLLRLDRAIFELLDARARLVEEMAGAGSDEPSRAGAPRVAADDILARHAGALGADRIRAIAAAIDGAFGAEPGARETGA